MTDYDCDVCRSFSQGQGRPTEAEPWDPDCYIHQYRWNKPRCERDLGEVRPGVDPEVRCELEAGHSGLCRFVYMEPEE